MMNQAMSTKNANKGHGGLYYQSKNRPVVAGPWPLGSIWALDTSDTEGVRTVRLRPALPFPMWCLTRRSKKLRAGTEQMRLGYSVAI